MSYILHDPDEYEAIINSRPCTNCGNGRRCIGVGCNGMFGVGYRRRSPDEIMRMKAERRRLRDDSILAEADLIRARRGRP